VISGAPGINPTRSLYSPLSDVYTAKGTAALGLADTGQAWFMMANPAGAELSVVSGKLTNTGSPAALRAGYVTANLGANVLRIGARFTLSSTTHPGGGAAGLVIWRSLLWTTNIIPDSGVHISISDIGWGLGVWETQVFTGIASGSFSPALATDDTTVHTFEATIAGSTVTLDLPANGGTPSVTDARVVSLAGPYACFEVYQTDASIDTKAKFTEVWALT
jgi:hypothetical protein